MEENKYRAFRESLKYEVKDPPEKKNVSSRKTTEEDPYKEERERTRGGGDERDKRVGFTRKQTLNVTDEKFDSKWFNDQNVEMLIEKMIHLESEYLGIAPFGYSYEDLDEGVDGQYDENEQRLYINRKNELANYADYKNLLDTIIHETRHKYQTDAMGNPEQYPEMKEISREYLTYSDITYPVDENRQDYQTEYLFNGLEEDARAYAAARAELYSEFSPEEILMMNTPPVEVVSNQILMTAGTKNKQGVNAPITVGRNYTSKGFSAYRAQHETSTATSQMKGDKMSAAREGTMNLSEEARNQALKVYGQLIEDIQTLSERMVEQMRERIKAHPSKQLDNSINTFIKYYQEVLPSEIKNAISEWKSSDNSIVASLRREKEGASDASVTAAKSLESGFADEVRFKAISEVKTDAPINVDKQQMLQDASFIHGCLSNVENVRNEWRMRMQQYSLQNAIYAPMEQLVVETFQHVEKVYDAAENDIGNKIAEGFEEGRTGTISVGQNTAIQRVKEKLNIRDSYTGDRSKR